MIKAGLIGEHLKHSISPEIHERLFKTESIDGTYELFETKKSGLKKLLKNLKSEGFTGVNVTIPHKTSVMKHLDYISDETKAIGAVNTIHFKDDKSYGYNTDYYGLKTLLESSEITLSDKRVVILGTGGASRCAAKLALDMGASEVLTVSRSDEKGDMTYSELEEMKSVDVLINTTPAGMLPDVYGCPVSDEIIEKCDSVVDVVYNPMKTQLIRTAEKLGKKKAAGLLMLTAQAVKAQEIWNEKNFEQSTYTDVFDYAKGIKTNVVIIGMPGSGKSVIGKMVSEKLGKFFVDTDSLIEKKHGSIPLIFTSKGEAEFRRYESEAAELAADLRGVVTATGGGIVLNKSNIDVLKKTGTVFFIDRPIEILLETIDGSYRPLISDDNGRIKKLYEQRYPLYLEYADHVVKNDADLLDCVDEIIRIWGKQI